MKTFWTGIILASLMIVTDASAADLARPYEAARAVSYGYDNDGGAPGCTDYGCGSICYNGHSGSDFPLSFGTNVLAGADGTVRSINNSCADYGSLGNTCGGRCGNYVQLQHPNGDYTIYCHMRRDSLTVSTGQSVSCGQVIGQSASSGSSTGPHLHLGWRPGGGSSTDVYTGSCTSSPGAWRNQGAYGEPPGADCGCVPSTEVCDGTDNNCDGTVDSGDVCEIDLLLQAPHAYAGTTTTDVNGDGIQNVCARFYSGFRCFEPTGEGWSQTFSSDLLAEEDGWGQPQYYSTIRMGDINGDGLADVCARHPGGFTCWLSTGEGFEEFDTVNWSDAGGWDRPQYYTTIRLADINGNGRDDVCARGASGWRCHLSTPEGFGERIEGPEWSNAAGFNRARYYGTIRVGDIDGDGLDDVCMREQNGYVCYRSTGDGFEHLTTVETMTDANGWGNIIYWPSIRLADIDGDGTLALCARNSAMLFCQRFDGTEFGERLQLGGLSNDTGWADPTNYATLRVGDVTGDGSDELCIRANARMLCYRVDGDEVTRIDGPEWSNAEGWDARSSHAPLFITNIDGDENGALCGRSSDGLTCATYADGSFETYPRFDEFTNSGGWTSRKYYSTIRMGAGSCRAGWCDEIEEPEPYDGPSFFPERGVPIGGGNDTGHEDDAGDIDEDAIMRVSTTSCAATPSDRPGGMALLFLSGLLGFMCWRRRSKRSASGAGLVAILCAMSLFGCQRPVADEAATATAASPTNQPATGTAGLFEDHDVLAIHGNWRVLGEAIEVPEGTDGPLRYQPVLVDDGQAVDWPMDIGPISEARFVGDEPTLFALSLNGTLYQLSLQNGEQARAIAHDVSSQVSVSHDGCCIAYINDGHVEAQTLFVHNLDRGEVSEVRLGYSLGWAPVVSPQGQRVAWTASPEGHAAILIADTENGEPQTIVNAGETRRSDELDPFPNGIHMPVWTPEGIAFEADATLWLIDEAGAFIGSADGRGGMFWDGARGLLIDSHGEAIVWE